MLLTTEIDKVPVLPEFPLEDKWRTILDRAARSAKPEPIDINREKYLDFAEILVRSVQKLGLQQEDGIVCEPYSHEDDKEYVYYRTVHISNITARFVGALGNLIKAGRCQDMVDNWCRGYDAMMKIISSDSVLDDVIAAEFWVRELLFAYDHMKNRSDIDRAVIDKWEGFWKTTYGAKYYWAFHCYTLNNYFAFAASSEQLKKELGFNYSMDLIDKCMDFILFDVDAYGLYNDPNNPMMYALVTDQLLDYLCYEGYDGKYRDVLSEICRRSSATFLMCQSAAGQAPYGGRSNQYVWNEAQSAVFYETRALACKKSGDMLQAGIFKRAARRSIAMIEPWVRMEPYRHIKTGFSPSANHSVDSGGFYYEYGMLLASTLTMAYHVAEQTEDIEEVITPAEAGGFVIELTPEFHKVFAACGGYSVEIDTHADIHKDTTGLGRIHKIGVRPETALSGSITATPEYDIHGDIPYPEKNLAIGPQWKDVHVGWQWRLADFVKNVRRSWLEPICETEDRVEFKVVYEGSLGSVYMITETYVIDSSGVDYTVEMSDPDVDYGIVVPLIQTDGLETSVITTSSTGFEVKYRGETYRITGDEPAEVQILEDKPAANRNAFYLTGFLKTGHVKFVLD